MFKYSSVKFYSGEIIHKKNVDEFRFRILHAKMKEEVIYYIFIFRNMKKYPKNTPRNK